jgi:type VI secretion system protein ImpH
MATGDGPGTDYLTHYDRLVANPQAFHIFHALRVLEARFRDAPPLGMSKRPREDRLRLGQEAELAFPPTTVRSFAPPGAGPNGAGPAVLVNRFFGFFGPHGPLPTHMTEYARERQVNARDPTLVAFADMLTHRMMSLLYRAWVTGQPAVSFDRGEDGMIERKVAALAGFPGSKLRKRDSMPDLAKRYFAGHMGAGTKTAEGLTAMLQAFFRVPVRMQQFVGCWLDLELDDRWRLGARAGLGRATSIGERVWSRAAKFRLAVGPLTLGDYMRLLPGGAAIDRLRDVVRGHVGDALDWDVNLILKADEVPRAVLGQNLRLGHVGWIGTRDGSSDAAELFLVAQPTMDTGSKMNKAA